MYVKKGIMKKAITDFDYYLLLFHDYPVTTG